MWFAALLILFIGLPLAELALLIKIGQLHGIGLTVALVVVTGITGASLARWQGFKILQRIRAELAQGRMPAPELLDGLLILVAGAVLLTPGLITDVLGFLLLVPASRRVIKGWVQHILKNKISKGVVDVPYVEW